MSDLAGNEIRPGDVTPPAARLGAELRAARLKLGWELPELANSLRIRQSYLEAIESGRMTELPGTTYALGFVRAYASALGLPGEEVTGRFRAESEEVRRRPALSFPAPVPQRGVPAGAVMLLGLVILACAYGGWYFVSEHRLTPVETVPPIPDRLAPAPVEKPAPSPQIASMLPNTQPPAPIASPPAAALTPPARMAAPNTAPAAAANSSPAPVIPAPASAPVLPPAPSGASPVLPAGIRVVLKTSADAWVTIKQPGGPALLNKLMHAGDSFAVPPDKPGLTVTTGNAGGTEIDVDGVAVAGLGGSGMVRRDLPLDADVLKSGHLPPIGHPHSKTAAPVEIPGGAPG